MFHPVRALSRGLLAAVFIGGGINQLKNPVGFPTDSTEKLVKQLNLETAGLPDAKTLVLANGAGMVGAGAALALGIKPKTAAAVLAALIVPTTLAGHRFWEIEDPMAKQQQLTEFIGNAGVLGGLLAVIAGKN